MPNIDAIFVRFKTFSTNQACRKDGDLEALQFILRLSTLASDDLTAGSIGPFDVTIVKGSVDCNLIIKLL